MIRKRRLPGAGERVKVGRRLIAVPGVTSMTNPNPAAFGAFKTTRVGDMTPGPGRSRPTTEYDGAGVRKANEPTNGSDKRGGEKLENAYVPVAQLDRAAVS
jgi:hypothetical protein